jgi:hypothetical protein
MSVGKLAVRKFSTVSVGSKVLVRDPLPVLGDHNSQGFRKVQPNQVQVTL